MTTCTRRGFLGSAAALAAFPVVRPGVAAAAVRAGRPERLKIGLASYSLRNFPLERALEMARAMDLRYMTFKDVHIPRTDSPDAIRAKCQKVKDAGITIMGGGTINMKNDEAQIRKDFEYAKHAGMPLIYTSPDPAALDFCERMVKEHDVRMVIHNHGPEDKWWPAPADAYKAIKSRDKRMGLCVDIGHTIRTGTDPVKAIVEHSDRVYDLHIKDLKDATDRDSQTEVGSGVMDIPELFRALLKMNYQGQVGLEYEINADDPMNGINESLTYMRGVHDALVPMQQT